MKFFLLIIAALIVENTIQAQPGTLDNTFNDSGKVLNYDFGVVCATAIQPDGKILVGGEIFTTELHAFTIVRYLPDGSVDESFGDNGKAQTAIAGGGVGIYNLSVLKSGKILAAGYGLVFFQFPIYQSPILAQYLPDGSPDPSFGD
ncbi:delta-60 repeat domain-containing protein, partial [Parafilimonas terrae]